MTHKRRHPEELLLDLHLDRLDDDERLWIEAELVRDPELRAKSDGLHRVLQPLDQWAAPTMPADLPDRVLAHIQEHKQRRLNGPSPLLKVVSADASAEVGEGNYRRSWLFSMKEALAVAACILLLFSVMVPSLSRARSHSQRTVCGSRLGLIHQGLAAYQEMSGGSLPFAGNTPGASWLPSGPKDAPRTSNSRHVFLVLRSRLVPSSEVFTCPADPTASPVNTASLGRITDFPDAHNISFDTLNMNGVDPPINPAFPIAYMSDRNPLFVGGQFNDDVDPENANSPIHDGGAGQNVLMLDGSSRWLTSPLWGPKLDNIWLAGTIRRYQGTETQSTPEDAFMVPGCPTTTTDQSARDGP